MSSTNSTTPIAKLMLLLWTALLLATGTASAAESVALSDDEVRNIVERSYQYVAMYNVNNKFALKQGGWNTCDADTQLKDHTMREIARPNNDTLYIICMLDLRQDPIILEMPAFDSDYASLMITAYDHYVKVPMSTRLDDFSAPARMLIYSERTEGYDGKQVEGIDRYFEATGDFVSAVLRIMPHANEPRKFQRIVEQMQSVDILSLSEYRGGKAKPPGDVNFPAVGETDADIYGDNLLEVMQFIFNHITFDPDNPEDQAVLAAYRPLGVVPGKAWDADSAASIDGERFRQASKDVQQEQLGKLADPDYMAAKQPLIFQPKGETTLAALIGVSVVGPIGIPQEEAVYPQVLSADGKPINAQYDYVVRMSPAEMPPAGAFWSLTLYDRENGFFIPNERKKYSVGKNGGMKLDDDGGIAIYIAAEQPDGVPEKNWLPIPREDLDLSLQLRLYEPELEKMKTWKAPVAERIDGV